MIIKNSLIFIEIYLLICLLLIFIILYNYLRDIRAANGTLIFDYILYPFLTLLVLGIMLHIFNFKYIIQYITICGPILGACVAIFVSYSTDKRQKEKESQKKLDHFEFNIGILNICKDAIKLELNNYEILLDKFKQNKVELPTLSSTPFNFLELFISAPQHEVFAAFIETKKHDKEKLKEIYLSISKNISNAIFVKQKAEQSYIEFINKYNLSANKLVESTKAINDIYRNQCVSKVNDVSFCSEFTNFIKTYNLKVNKGEISMYNIVDIEINFINPLKAILINADMSLSMVIDLIKEYENLYVALDKIKELREFILNNFSTYRDSIKQISETIEQNSKLL